MKYVINPVIPSVRVALTDPEAAASLEYLRAERNAQRDWEAKFKERVNANIARRLMKKADNISMLLRKQAG